jgi:hypothetical protein
MTMTRDRLAYTQHCFAQLRALAGCEYDHYVLDQASEDGSGKWLQAEWASGSLKDLWRAPSNVGCCAGWNTILREMVVPEEDRYDVVICFDNDCELTMPYTVINVAELAHRSGEILAPRVQGLRNPPPTVNTFVIDDVMVEETAILGNVFMAIPVGLLRQPGGYRWDERHQVWAGGEAITSWHRQRGGRCGYVASMSVNHYETTLGQVRRYPEYFARRVKEGGPPL